MAKYRKRPIIVDAVQFDGANQPPGVCFCVAAGTEWAGGGNVMAVPHVHTLEGPLKVSQGDYIIRGVAGEYYPCKPDIFEKTYEATDIWIIPAEAAAKEK